MSNYPVLREASSRSLGHGFLRTPERPLLQWTPSINQWNPIHYTEGQPCLQANCLSRPSTPDHPHRMTRRPATRMPRVPPLPLNGTCRRVTHPSTDRARRCLTSERSRPSQPHHLTSERSRPSQPHH